MEEKDSRITFHSLTFIQKLAGLNYLAIKSEEGQRKKWYEFSLGLPVFIIAGIIFLHSRSPDQKYFVIERFVICGALYFSVLGLTRLFRFITPDELKQVMDKFRNSQNVEIRKTTYKYALVYYGFSTVTIAIVAFCY